MNRNSSDKPALATPGLEHADSSTQLPGWNNPAAANSPLDRSDMRAKVMQLFKASFQKDQPVWYQAQMALGCVRLLIPIREASLIEFQKSDGTPVNVVGSGSRSTDLLEALSIPGIRSCLETGDIAVLEEDRLPLSCSEAEIASVLFIPLRKEEQLLGVMSLALSYSVQFSADLFEVAQDVADRMVNLFGDSAAQSKTVVIGEQM